MLSLGKNLQRYDFFLAIIGAVVYTIAMDKSNCCEKCGTVLTCAKCEVLRRASNGGKKSRRTLTSEQAREMVAKRKLKNQQKGS